MNLYEIDNAILECVDQETGEIIDTDKLTSLQMARDEKIENIGAWIKNLLSDAEQLKAEKMKLADRQSEAERKAASLKNYLTTALDGEKFNSPRVAIGWRKSAQLHIIDIDKLPKKYLKFAAPTADKTGIKKAIEAGENIEGAEIVRINNIQIK